MKESQVLSILTLSIHLRLKSGATLSRSRQVAACRVVLTPPMPGESGQPARPRVMYPWKDRRCLLEQGREVV